MILIANGYVGVSPLLALIALIIGNIMATNASAINPKRPNPNNRISGIQIIE